MSVAERFSKTMAGSEGDLSVGLALASAVDEELVVLEADIVNHLSGIGSVLHAMRRELTLRTGTATSANVYDRIEEMQKLGALLDEAIQGLAELKK